MLLFGFLQPGTDSFMLRCRRVQPLLVIVVGFLQGLQLLPQLLPRQRPGIDLLLQRCIQLLLFFPFCFLACAHVRQLLPQLIHTPVSIGTPVDQDGVLLA